MAERGTASVYGFWREQRNLKIKAVEVPRNDAPRKYLVEEASKVTPLEVVEAA